MMRSFLLLSLAGLLAPHSVNARLMGESVSSFQNDSSLCQVVQADLPEECSCKDNAAGPLSFLVECTKVFANPMLNDTIGIDLEVAPCDPMGSSIALNLTEQAHGIDLQIAGVRAGEETNLPIPGLSAMVPGLGSVGLDADIYVYGNPSSLTLQVGLNACAMVHTHQICAAAIPGLNMFLPWWILKGNYSFGTICDQALEQDATVRLQ